MKHLQRHIFFKQYRLGSEILVLISPFLSSWRGFMLKIRPYSSWCFESLALALGNWRLETLSPQKKKKKLKEKGKSVPYQQSLVLLEWKKRNSQDFNSPKNLKANEEKTPSRDRMYSFHPKSYKTKHKIIKRIKAMGVNLNSGFKNLLNNWLWLTILYICQASLNILKHLDMST